MSLNTCAIILLQIYILFILTKQSIAREIARNQFQTNRIPVRFQPQTTSQWNPATAQTWMNPATAQTWMNPATAQSWRNPMAPQWNTGTWQRGSTIPSSTDKNNQDFRVGSSAATGFPGFGKLRLLATLFSGLRNTGLEETIAGEVLQRVFKTLLRDIIVPFKREMFQFS